MKQLIIIGLMVVFALTSCKDYLDINRDPNSPSSEDLNPSLIFPGSEMNLCSQYGNFLRITGGYFAQYYSQTFGTSNYIDYSRWIMTATRGNTNYSRLSTLGLKNLEIIREMTSEGEEWGTYLAATTLRAFIFQIFVDTYGEVPYTEALDVSNLAPHYDTGQTIYEGVLAELNEALSKVSTSHMVCTNFLFGTFTANEWIQFANALKLKLLMRMSDVKDVRNELSALIAEGNFPNDDVAWSGFWVNESGKANPFYQEEYATYFGSTQQNVVANIALIGTMKDYNDARLQAAFNSNSNGDYTGAVSGTNFSQNTSLGAAYWCRPRVTYNSPVFLITVSEIEFFLAEYYARYGGGDAAAHYQAAVEASFNTLGASGSNVVLAAYPWDAANYKRVIGIQKWIALGCTNPFEGWCELRRLKYPSFGTVTGAQLFNIQSGAYSPDLYVPGYLYPPIEVNAYLEANTVLQRFQYPESSATRNPNALKFENSMVNKPVFWAN